MVKGGLREMAGESQNEEESESEGVQNLEGESAPGGRGRGAGVGWRGWGGVLLSFAQSTCFGGQGAIKSRY